MNTDAITDAAIRLSKLTPQEHLIASELAQRLRMGGKPMSQPESHGRKRKPPFNWTEEYTAMAKSAAEDSTIQSPRQRHLSLEKLAESIGTDFKVVQRKVDTIRRNSKK